jgi:hypothetical protein
MTRFCEKFIFAAQQKIAINVQKVANPLLELKQLAPIGWCVCPSSPLDFSPLPTSLGDKYLCHFTMGLRPVF